jgi:hypothetical protein
MVAIAILNVVSTLVECLCCGTTRETKRGGAECPRCRYVGWAPVEALTERDRRALRDRPLERRRLRIA